MKLARTIGLIVQSFILGSLLFLAVCQMAMLATGARVFKYQGF